MSDMQDTCPNHVRHLNLTSPAVDGGLQVRLTVQRIILPSEAT